MAKILDKAKASDAEVAVSVPALVVEPEVTKAGEVAVIGNFATVEAHLKQMTAKYENLVITPDQIDLAMRIKIEMRTYRTSLTKITDDAKKQYFNGPKAVFERRMAELQAYVSKIESKIDAVLEVENQKQRDDLNLILDEYKDELQERFKLPATYLARVEFKDKYYNKTAVEKETKADLLAQFAELDNENKNFQAAARLVKKACADEARINMADQLKKLERGEAVATIIEYIDSEKERLKKIDAHKTVGEDQPNMINGESCTIEYEEEVDEDAMGQGDEDVPETPAKLILGVADKIDFASDIPARKKMRLFVLEYPQDTGDALSELFKKLKEFGIITRAMPENITAIDAKLKELGFFDAKDAF